MLNYWPLYVLIKVVVFNRLWSIQIYPVFLESGDADNKTQDIGIRTSERFTSTIHER